MGGGAAAWVGWRAGERVAVCVGSGAVSERGVVTVSVDPAWRRGRRCPVSVRSVVCVLFVVHSRGPCEHVIGG